MVTNRLALFYHTIRRNVQRIKRTQQGPSFNTKLPFTYKPLACDKALLQPSTLHQLQQMDKRDKIDMKENGHLRHSASVNVRKKENAYKHVSVSLTPQDMNMLHDELAMTLGLKSVSDKPAPQAPYKPFRSKTFAAPPSKHHVFSMGQPKHSLLMLPFIKQVSQSHRSQSAIPAQLRYLFHPLLRSLHH